MPTPGPVSAMVAAASASACIAHGAVLPVWIGPPPQAIDRRVVRFSGGVSLPARPERALLRVSGQQRFRVDVNGRPVTLGDAATPWVFDIGGHLKIGDNRVDVTVLSDAAPGPANAWVVLERRLSAPVSAERLIIEAEGALGDEWLYVEVIDALNRTSGYYCAEKGHPDLRLGSSGALSKHTLDLLRDDRMPYRASEKCDLSKISAVRIRVDQKTTGDRPAGGVVFPCVRLEGTAPVDLSGADGWVLLPGQGDHRRSVARSERNKLALTYDFHPIPDVRLAVDLRAFAKGKEIGRLVSGATWTSDAGGVAVVSRGKGPGGLHTDYWPTDIRDTRETGAPPITGLVDLRVNDGVDRLEQSAPLSVSARVRALWPNAIRTVCVRARTWAGAVAAEAMAPVVWDAEAGTAEVTLPGLQRGLYRLSADMGSAVQCHERAAALAVLGPGEKRVSALFDTIGPFGAEIKGLQGVDLSYQDSPALLVGLRQLGVNFLQFHLEPSQIDNGELDELIAFCKATHTRFALNNETSNWAPSSLRADGADRFAAANGCHRWDIEPPALAKAAATGLFEGVVYDEGEHMQMCRNFYSGLPEPVHRKPYLVETTGKTLPQAYEAFVEAARSVAAHNRNHGGRMLVESVFPVLWHPLARAGATLCPKLLKEDIHPVVLAQALGAARQYGADLWFSPDLWHMDQLPGHSVREYRAALRLADSAGVDNVYTEFVTCLALYRGAEFDITPYGQVLQEHVRKVLPARKRAYTYRDYRPEVAIIRFPDSDWGQASSGYWNTLYGAEDLHSTAETREWLVLWSLITNGATNEGAVNTNSGVYDRYQWQFSVPSPSVAIFDHLVGEEALEGVRTIYLCGIEVSPGTLDAVRECVEAGATCIAAERLCPADVREFAVKNHGHVKAGRGEWIVVDGFRPGSKLPGVQSPGQTMRLRFDAGTVTVSDP